MCQKGFSLFWATLLKCRWSLKSTLNFQALGTFRVHQLNCYQTPLWGALGKSGGKEGGEEPSKCCSESPAPPLQPEQFASTCLIYICVWTSSCPTKKGGGGERHWKASNLAPCLTEEAQRSWEKGSKSHSKFIQQILTEHYYGPDAQWTKMSALISCHEEWGSSL